MINTSKAKTVTQSQSTAASKTTKRTLTAKKPGVPRFTTNKKTVATKPSEVTSKDNEDEKNDDDDGNFCSDYEEDSPVTVLRKQRLDLANFKVKLAKRGLWVKNTTGDGNCLFRALADQLYGKEYMHRRLRESVVQTLIANKEQYKFFIENDRSVNQYIRVIKEDGSWGGQLEISILA